MVGENVGSPNMRLLLLVMKLHGRGPTDQTSTNQLHGLAVTVIVRMGTLLSKATPRTASARSWLAAVTSQLVQILQLGLQAVPQALYVSSDLQTVVLAIETALGLQLLYTVRDVVLHEGDEWEDKLGSKSATIQLVLKFSKDGTKSGNLGLQARGDGRRRGCDVEHLRSHDVGSRTSATFQHEALTLELSTQTNEVVDQPRPSLGTRGKDVIVETHALKDVAEFVLFPVHAVHMGHTNCKIGDWNLRVQKHLAQLFHLLVGVVHSSCSLDHQDQQAHVSILEGLHDVSAVGQDVREQGSDTRSVANTKTATAGQEFDPLLREAAGIG
mmetsp:Transcript_62597/g.136857  ORF Transcript_62597/g.136857 Transcript_62597/m.136857 type:complete len:327 (-) Transcript_62597:198-1178(-)